MAYQLIASRVAKIAKLQPAGWKRSDMANLIHGTGGSPRRAARLLRCSDLSMAIHLRDAAAERIEAGMHVKHVELLAAAEWADAMPEPSQADEATEAPEGGEGEDEGEGQDEQQAEAPVAQPAAAPEQQPVPEKVNIAQYEANLKALNKYAKAIGHKFTNEQAHQLAAYSKTVGDALRAADDVVKASAD